MPQDTSNQLPPEVQKALAEQLRDVHLPDAISWWPIAWGWWLLIVLLSMTVATGIVLIIRKRAKNRYRGLAISELNNAFDVWHKDQHSQAYLHHANDILKRTILGNHTLESRRASEITTLSGQAWVDQLNSWAQTPLTQDSQNALAFDCYKKNPVSNIKALHADLIPWLKTHKVNKQEANKYGGQHA